MTSEIFHSRSISHASSALVYARSVSDSWLSCMSCFYFAQVGFTREGKVQAVDITMYANDGYISELGWAVSESDATISDTQQMRNEKKVKATISS